MPVDRAEVKVGVLCGGDSPEREVSLRSGQGVHAALNQRGFRAELIAIETYDGLPKRLAPFAVVFNVLHGGAGEDGTVQLLLDLLGKPYVGSGPLASALAMDKAEARRALRSQGIPIPDGLLVTRDQADAGLARVQRELGLPLIVKPRAQGSSVALHLVKAAEELREALEEVFALGDALVERYIPGQEITAAVLEGDGLRVLPLVELRPKAGLLFDWQAKYTPGECEFVCPTELPAAVSHEVAEVARTAFTALGCRDFARVDLRLSPDGTPYVLEVNTLPGMTEMSTFPRAAAAAGIPYDELVEGLLRRALSRLPSPSGLGRV